MDSDPFIVVKAGSAVFREGDAGTAMYIIESGSVDIVTSGTTNMLLLWGKTNGDVKTIAGVSGLPFKLVTRNPNIKTIKDYTPADRIALPTVRVSIQAMTLGIALQKTYGDDKANEKLLANQVQMGHPDATAAMLNPVHEVTSHFSASPFQEMLLSRPGYHAVLESRDALGGGAHIAVAFTTTKFSSTLTTSAVMTSPMRISLRLRLSSNSAAKDSPAGDLVACGETLAINEKTFSNRRLASGLR